ncbi:alpha/beta fold hydrolase [Cupriavidus plantarum]|uniref:alpha/beta fold hydrolase n=1 Tax=Cupriavidus plantarum TaxID=942865 RepID=UPI0018069540|nr:alpha/beta hydrolase [Cupriavidus plantarum]NYI00573.1 pimeloyl-ACP methyl ester carboxylesterase [Cupriavidus plantarum]
MPQLRIHHRLKPLFAAVVMMATAHCAHALERWQTLPPTPAPVKWAQERHSELRGIRLYNAEVGKGSPVIVLHGGLANSDYLAHQIRTLSANHRVIAVDSRGHGRSTRDDTPYGYDLMADDVIALMDELKIPRADIVGWSDGAIQALDIAIRHPERVGKIVAFGVNTRTDGLIPAFDQNPVFAAYIERAGKEYTKLSPTPNDYDAFLAQIGKMWETEPNWTDAQLKTIQSPVLVMDGDHDEGIKRSHTAYIARTIPHARMLILPNASHFAFMQDPKGFDAAIVKFLDGKH